MKIRSPYEEMEEPEQEMPQMARGGMVDPFSMDDPYSVEGGASSTVKTPPLPPPAAAAMPPVAPAQAPMDQKPMMAAPVAPKKPLPGMPAGVTPDDLKGYLDKQRSAIGKFDPSAQYDREMSMQNARSGIVPRLAQAAATFAGPEYAKANNDRWDQAINQSAGSFERAREGTMKQVSANQEIDFMDPSSTMSKLYQQTFAPIFAKMGYDPADVAKMPASKISTIASLGIQFEDAQSQQELKRAMLGLQGMTAKANILNQQEQRKQTASKERVDAAKDLLSKSGNAKVLGIPIPFTSDVSGSDKEAALNIIRGQMKNGETPDFEDEASAEAAGLPRGTEITIGGRRARVK